MFEGSPGYTPVYCRSQAVANISALSSYFELDESYFSGYSLYSLWNLENVNYMIKKLWMNKLVKIQEIYLLTVGSMPQKNYDFKQFPPPRFLWYPNMLILDNKSFQRFLDSSSCSFKYHLSHC